MIAIVNFRTLANGSYKWIKRGQRRGYWRVLMVRDVAGSTMVTSRNVLSVAYISREGIDGVTERSAYCLDGARQTAEALADKMNIARLGANIAAAYHPLAA